MSTSETSALAACDGQKTGNRCQNNPPCAVISRISDSLVFVNYDPARYCPFCMSFGNGYICCCEERMKKYREMNL